MKEDKVFTNIKKIDRDEKVQINLNVETLQVWEWDNSLRIDKTGIWLGNKRFSLAPFSVDMNGDAKINNLDLNGYISGLASSIIANVIDSDGNIKTWTVNWDGNNITSGTGIAIHEWGISWAVDGTEIFRLSLGNERIHLWNSWCYLHWDSDNIYWHNGTTSTPLNS